MAKKTGWENWGDEKPLEEHVHLPMVADTTVEAAVDIDTGIDPGAKFGWGLLGMDFCFRTIATPFHTVPIQSCDASMTLQLARGEAPDTPVLLDPADDDEIFTFSYNYKVDTDVGYNERDAWFRLRKMERTQKPKLHLVFGTSADIVDVSAATNEIFCIIYYRLIDAPPAPGHDE